MEITYTYPTVTVLRASLANLAIEIGIKEQI
jgi:hypothetical protein